MEFGVSRVTMVAGDTVLLVCTGHVCGCMHVVVLLSSCTIVLSVPIGRGRCLPTYCLPSGWLVCVRACVLVAVFAQAAYRWQLSIGQTSTASSLN